MSPISILMRIVRTRIEALGVPPDQLQDLLADIECDTARVLGGAHHYFSRVQEIPVKAKIIDLYGTGVTAQQAAERLSVTDRYVQKVWQQIRPTD